MLIKIPKVYIDGTNEETIDIWINFDRIIRIEPLNFKNSIAKSHISIKDVEPWNSIKSTLTPDEIAKLGAWRKYKKSYLSCPTCGNFSWADEPDHKYVRCSVCGTVFNKADITIKEEENETNKM